MVAVAEALTIAREHHESGRLDMAEQIYREILRVEPGHADALCLLGVLAGQSGKYQQAVELLGEALRARDHPVVHLNLGGAYIGLGNSQEAIACYHRALKLQPEYAEAYYGLGRAQLALRRLDEAAASFRRAVQLKPDYAEAHFSLGNVLADKGAQAEAAACYRQTLQLRPQYVQALNNLGTTQLNEGKPKEAVASYQRALQIKPDYVEALANLGLAWRNLGQADEATACLRQVLSLKPDHAAALNNLGNVLKEKGELAEALACYRQAVQCRPDYVEADSNVLTTLHFCPGYDSAAIYQECCRWNQQHAKPLAAQARPHGNDRSAERRLRVGYVSPDFRDHVVGRHVWPLLSHHNPAEFEVILYADLARADWMTDRFRERAQGLHNITGWTNDRVAEQIRADRIDILLDLALHMASNRLLVFARKAAPVQVTFAGYPGTTGLAAMDYRLTDPYLDPPGMFDRWYSEESYRLPNSFWCYDPLTSEPVVSELPALKKGHLTFGCFNNFCKVNVPMLRIWAKVLRAQPRSRLILQTPEGKHRGETARVLQEEGIAADRLTFVANRTRLRYLELYQRIDVGLDTLPYNGHTTSLDSAWMGVPVVTLVGQTVVGRAGFSQLSNLNLPELIAYNPEQFVQAASALTSDLGRLASLRGSLRERMQASPLMDAPRFALDIEAAYRAMWRRWCAALQ
jgi:predicted O-linked N-acetylglucosamine transferase (SPINDLY family)